MQIRLNQSTFGSNLTMYIIIFSFVIWDLFLFPNLFLFFNFAGKILPDMPERAGDVARGLKER